MPSIFTTSRKVRPLQLLGWVGALCLACYVAGASSVSPATSDSNPAPTPPACTVAVTPAG